MRTKILIFLSCLWWIVFRLLLSRIFFCFGFQQFVYFISVCGSLYFKLLWCHFFKIKFGELCAIIFHFFSCPFFAQLQGFLIHLCQCAWYCPKGLWGSAYPLFSLSFLQFMYFCWSIFMFTDLVFFCYLNPSIQAT